MSKPILSIGLPVYNRETFLRQSLDALLAQTFTDFELIISDNASTDGTGDICRDYAKCDRRIQYHRNPSNIGAPLNFNRTFELSSSKYFKWATSDDLCGPRFLELALEVLEKDSAVVLCYAKSRTIARDGSPIEDYEDNLHLEDPQASRRFMRLVTTIALCHQHQGVIRSAALRQTGMLKIHLGSDVNLLAELTLYGKFYELPERLFFRRLHPDSPSWSHDDRERLMEFYDPGQLHGIVLHRFRQHVANLTAIRRAPIGFGEKAVLYRFIVHQMVQDRSYLVGELGLKGRVMTNRILQRRHTPRGSGLIF